MRAPSPVSYLRLFVGILFAVIGVLSIIGMDKSGIVVGQDIPGIQILFGIIEILGGLALIVTVFTSFHIAYLHLLSVILFYTWLVKIVLNILSLAIPGYPSLSGVSLSVDGWILSFTIQVTMAAALHVTYKEYNLL